MKGSFGGFPAPLLKGEARLLGLVAVECKSGERSASGACRYFREQTDIPRFYQVHLGSRDFGSAEANTRVLPFATFCRELELP